MWFVASILGALVGGAIGIAILWVITLIFILRRKYAVRFKLDNFNFRRFQHSSKRDGVTTGD
jgi:hypothetical protein